MATLDIRNRKFFLVRSINKLLEEYSEPPDKLIVTKSQFRRLVWSKQVETPFTFGKKKPEDCLFYAKNNVLVMEFEVVGLERHHILKSESGDRD